MTPSITRHAVGNLGARFWREVCDREPASRFQRRQKAGVEFPRARQVVVNIPQEDSVTTLFGKVGGGYGTFQHYDIRERFLLDQVPGFSNLCCPNVCGIDTPARPQPL